MGHFTKSLWIFSSVVKFISELFIFKHFPEPLVGVEGVRKKSGPQSWTQVVFVVVDKLEVLLRMKKDEEQSRHSREREQVKQLFEGHLIAEQDKLVSL